MQDLGIPSIRIYINSVNPWLPARIQATTSYSKVTFVDKPDQADMWILDMNGQFYGRTIHGKLIFRDASEPLLRVAFAQIFPLFRLMLQLELGGILEIYTGPQSLAELESLDNSPELKSPATTWYSLSKDDCFIRDEAVSILFD